MFVNRARYRGNELIDGKLEAVASTKGTSITVDDLFYTIPSRHTMYLGKESEETKQIVSLLQLFSIHYAPQGISFLLKEIPSRVLFKSPRCTSLEESIAGVLGSAIRPTLRRIRVDRESGVECPFSAEIVLSPKSPIPISPAVSFVLFVNGRAIQNSRLRQGIRRVLEQYYYCSDSNSRSRNQSQFCYVSMEIDTRMVDVNVHPNKREVCFLDEDYVVKRIVETVETEIDRVLSQQAVGKVTPTKSVSRGDGSCVGSASKKVRVDYSQRTIQFATQENSICLDDSLMSEEGANEQKQTRRESGTDDGVGQGSTGSTVSTMHRVSQASNQQKLFESPIQTKIKGNSSPLHSSISTPNSNPNSNSNSNATHSPNSKPNSTHSPNATSNSNLPSNSQSIPHPSLSFIPSQPSSLDTLSSSLSPSPSPSPCFPHTQGRRSLAILSDNAIDTPYKPTRDDLQLSSVFALCEDVRIAGSNCSNPREILQKSVFIACLDDTSSAVAQFENGLYLFRVSLIL